ncbi:MAG: hypothetical protein MHM6MM_009086, partial [Cercozoa sp. M6MM]
MQVHHMPVHTITLQFSDRSLELKASSIEECGTWYACFVAYCQTPSPVPQPFAFAIRAVCRVLRQRLSDLQDTSVAGIFRVGGEAARVHKTSQTLLRQVPQRSVDDDNAPLKNTEVSMLQQCDTPTLASVLKWTLRMLPESIFTDQLVDAFVSIETATAKTTLSLLPDVNLYYTP